MVVLEAWTSILEPFLDGRSSREADLEVTSMVKGNRGGFLILMGKRDATERYPALIVLTGLLTKSRPWRLRPSGRLRIN